MLEREREKKRQNFDLIFLQGKWCKITGGGFQCGALSGVQLGLLAATTGVPVLYMGFLPHHPRHPRQVRRGARKGGRRDSESRSEASTSGIRHASD